MNFLVERKFDRIACRLEFRFWRIDRGNYDAPASIDNVFDKAQCVPFFFLGLLEKMLRQLRERLRGEMRPNRVILQLRAELISDLLVNRIDYLLTRKHGKNVMRICLDASVEANDNFVVKMKNKMLNIRTLSVRDQKSRWMSLSERMTLPGQTIQEFVYDFPGLLWLFKPRHVSTPIDKLKYRIPD